MRSPEKIAISTVRGFASKQLQFVKRVSMATGTVKWFNAQKGFGFIVADIGGADILLHGNVLRNYGQSSVAEGTVIEVSVQETARGLQAVEVIGIELQQGIALQLNDDVVELTAADLAACPLEPARVKWFDKIKGFGFANVYGRSEDVFIHIEVLRRSGFADLQAGEAVCLRIFEGERGRMVAQVCAWESALRSVNS